MISMKNVSAEDVEVITHYDTNVPGCRVIPGDMAPNVMKPGEELQFLGYEPGISYTIRPVKEPELPRTMGIEPGAFPKVEKVG